MTISYLKNSMNTSITIHRDTGPVHVDNRGVFVGSQHEVIPYGKMKNIEYSTDRKTWHKCETLNP